MKSHKSRVRKHHLDRDPLDLINIRDLGYFIQVAESGGFSKASAVVAVAQPTLSRYIRNLEDKLGAALFHRNGRGVLLTDAGKHLFDHGKAIFAQVRQVRADLSDISAPSNSSVILGVPAAGRSISVAIATRFLQELPQSRLQLIEGFTGHIREWLINGRIDIGLVYENSIKPSILGEALWADSLYLMGPSTTPLIGRKEIPFVEVANLPLIIPSRPHDLRMLIDDVMRSNQIPMRIVMEADGIPAILDLVAADLGFTILPRLAVSNFMKGKKILAIRLVKPDVRGTLIMATSPQRPTTNCTRALLEIIRQEARALAPEIPTKGA